MDPIVRTSELVLYHGLAQDWDGKEEIDLVFTNPYGPMPKSLVNHRMVIHQWVHRKREAERWCGNDLRHCIGTWNIGREAFWSANIFPEVVVDIARFRPEDAGWYTEEMVKELLTVFGRPGWTIWDGFMGRGTIGKIALSLGMRYVGVEELERHLIIARRYLDV